MCSKNLEQFMFHGHKQYNKNYIHLLVKKKQIKVLKMFMEICACKLCMNNVTLIWGHVQ